MPIDRREAADPARSMALLWRTKEPKSRKGGPDLSVDRIVRTAIGIADAEGVGGLTMRQVSQALGVGTMSMYTYVPGKAELLDLMTDTVYGEVELPPDVPGGWRARLELVARANRALYRRHPWLLQVETGRPVLGPNLLAKYDYELRAIADIGLTDVEMDAALSLVLDVAKSAERAAADMRELERETGMTDGQWWQAYGPWLQKFAESDRYPVASRVGTAASEAHGRAYDPDYAFEFSLQRVLDGLAVVVDQRAGPGSRPL
ncbi:TetR/AcrR family transcriptional regulator [Microtetraspora niveoalba]|uniref:TetR/AcrR family transcriptional regulator n=1 Tax=Microtetraspora niveoalba TaxID=46175 RepID=UPI000832AD95|nr:TetR/AcrR family transcriptional regulator [Microtetraspora niveoalba]